jgi:hypothetical protein
LPVLKINTEICTNAAVIPLRRQQKWNYNQ